MVLKGSPETVEVFDDPALMSFVEAVDEKLNLDRSESLFELSSDFSTLVASGFAQRVVRNRLKSLAKVPGDVHGLHSRSFVPYSQPGFAVTLLMRDRSRSITSTPFLGMYIPMSAPLTVDVYALPTWFKESEFSPTVELAHLRSEEIPVGAVFLCRDVDRFVYDFTMASPIVLARASLSAHQGMQWFFDRSSLRATSSEMVEGLWRELKVAANILGAIGNRSSSEALSRLASHPHFEIRWAALRSLTKVDRVLAEVCLRQAAENDGHPAIRSAARKILQGTEGK